MSQEKPSGEGPVEKKKIIGLKKAKKTTKTTQKASKPATTKTTQKVSKPATTEEPEKVEKIDTGDSKSVEMAADVVSSVESLNKTKGSEAVEASSDAEVKKTADDTGNVKADTPSEAKPKAKRTRKTTKATSEPTAKASSDTDAGDSSVETAETPEKKKTTKSRKKTSDASTEDGSVAKKKTTRTRKKTTEAKTEKDAVDKKKTTEAKKPTPEEIEKAKREKEEQEQKLREEREQKKKEELRKELEEKKKEEFNFADLRITQFPEYLLDRMDKRARKMLSYSLNKLNSMGRKELTMCIDELTVNKGFFDPQYNAEKEIYYHIIKLIQYLEKRIKEEEEEHGKKFFHSEFVVPYNKGKFEKIIKKYEENNDYNNMAWEIVEKLGRKINNFPYNEGVLRRWVERHLSEHLGDKK